MKGSRSLGTALAIIVGLVLLVLAFLWLGAKSVVAAVTPSPAPIPTPVPAPVPPPNPLPTNIGTTILHLSVSDGVISEVGAVINVYDYSATASNHKGSLLASGTTVAQYGPNLAPGAAGVDIALTRDLSQWANIVLEAINSGYPAAVNYVTLVTNETNYTTVIFN